MNIVLDVMGENGPEAIVHGAIEALLQLPDKDFRITLVGKESDIKSVLQFSHELREKYRRVKNRIEIVNAVSVIGMKNSPESVNEDSDSSIAVGMELVRQGKGDALVSPGNTGAVVTSACTKLGLLSGMYVRPAIATCMPTLKDLSILLDSGATTDCKPRHLLRFAIIGRVYAQAILGKQNPSIGILSNGDEECKGNKLVQGALAIIKKVIPDARYIEGFDIARGTTDVIVCDGFIGNIILKVAEGIYSALKRILSIVEKKKKVVAVFGLSTLLIPPLVILVTQPSWFLLTYFPAWLIAFLTLRPIYKFLKRRFDWREHGGAPLLGVQGTVIIAHGRSSWVAIMNAIREAVSMARSSVNDTIVTELARINEQK